MSPSICPFGKMGPCLCLGSLVCCCKSDHGSSVDLKPWGATHSAHLWSIKPSLGLVPEPLLATVQQLALPKSLTGSSASLDMPCCGWGGWSIGLLSRVEGSSTTAGNCAQHVCACSHRGLANAALVAEVRSLPSSRSCAAWPWEHHNCKGSPCPEQPGSLAECLLRHQWAES